MNVGAGEGALGFWYWVNVGAGEGALGSWYWVKVGAGEAALKSWCWWVKLGPGDGALDPYAREIDGAGEGAGDGARELSSRRGLSANDAPEFSLCRGLTTSRNISGCFAVV